ncbi:MAG: type IV pilin-like G/H family protein, partial [Coleofasciculus sp.]
GVELKPNLMGRKTGTDATGVGCFLGLMLMIGGMIYILVPLFFNHCNYTKKSEGKTYVGSMNRAQQAYYLTEQSFSSNIDDLGLGIPTETESYAYSTQITDNAAFNYGISRHDATPSYVGAVFAVPATDVNPDPVSDKITTVAILCETGTPGSIKPAAPTYQKGELACGEGTIDLSR